MSATDPFLALPLTGTHLIEASAGTGKTFTLATLVTRLVIEQRLRIGQILAVTFTEAATQELRKRIRERLALAARLVDVPARHGAGAGEAVAIAPDDAPPDARLSRAVIAAHLADGDETPAQLQRRLRDAADEIDLAAIFTIHGFCARVLREHALESGQTFAPPELLPNDRPLREELAADLWRATAADAHDAPLLMSLWPGGPEALARDLAELVRQPRLLPPRPAATDEDAGETRAADAALRRAGQALAEAFAAHGDGFRAALVDAVDAKILNGQSYKTAWIHALWQDMAHWCAVGDWSAPVHPKLPMLAATALEAKTNKAHIGRTPASPVCASIPPYLAAVADVAAAQERARVRLLHRLRDAARTRLAQRKQQLRVQTYDDLIDGVADALAGPHAAALVARLRAQYAAALVDEFQDTDTRQWAIFRTVFGAGAGAAVPARDAAGTEAAPPAIADAPAADALGQADDSDTPAPFLALIGDPKQAIYGFRGGDVQTYLQAAAHARPAPALDRNFRSRPAVLAAIDALYTQAGTRAFLDERIRFIPVQPGTQRTDADYRRHGADAPALTLWHAPDPPADDGGKRKPHGAQRARELATAACVAAIHAVLSDARAGTASIDGKPVQPGDIAVLVRKHGEATRIQQALAAVGIPAVAAGKQSLFATPEAHELLTLLLALLHTADDARLRAALATVLLGLDAAGIAALDDDGAAHRDWQHKALAWRERWQRGGPLALVSDLCADNGARLLGLLDGERRLTNYLQLGELLQQADARALGLHGLVDWLGQQIAQADPDDETQLLRLESDARRVQIVTLHKSKGLEYPLVFLPFVGIGGKAPDPGRACVVADADGHRALHWKLQPDISGWNAARSAWIDAQRAEDARLLYVGLTRAEHALWIATGAFYNAAQTPLAAMLDGLPDTPGIVHDATSPATPPWLPPADEGTVPTARAVTRTLAPDWWVYSFTQLANADSGGHDASTRATVAAAGGHDEPADAPGPATASDPAQPDAPFDPRFAGTRFGVVLHEALEEGDFAAWHDWQPGDPAPADERVVIDTALRGGGYAADDLDDGLHVLTDLIGQTLTTALPEGVRLCDVPADARRAEIEFQFALQPTAVDALLALLHAHGLVRDRHGFGLRRTLEGLMTGLIDLTYAHDGRWYVLDYKSNRLPAYDADSLQRAMAHSEYDLQALIYTLALHRWLRFRLGDAEGTAAPDTAVGTAADNAAGAADRRGYDYARDFGGIRYLFCRGLDATRPDAPGVYAHRFAPELIHALDALFAGTPAETTA
ncbi:UvrD-helicase domain-containing protein [Luteimonas abyssi]|uniref:UvrD-helicase domain-containing protein n=1 Tax=Luteimonas abyssi TaxID=1247514 RepID=UPI000737BBD3|nr:exodeoxyribonuclease V subunit beta [Luteimonas abyssi]